MTNYETIVLVAVLLSGFIAGAIFVTVVNEYSWEGRPYTGMDVEYAYNSGLCVGYNTAVEMTENNESISQVLFPWIVRDNAERYGIDLMG